VSVDEAPLWLDGAGDGVIIRLHIAPKARHNEVQGTHGSALKIRLTAPPVEGAANRALVEFLAERLGVRRQQIAIVSGQHSRDKVVQVQSVTVEQAIGRLLQQPSARG